MDVLRPGDVVDRRFRVQRSIGSGGMATVLEVQDVTTAKRYAMKVLHRQLLLHPVIPQRFLREAHAVCALSTPFAVKVETTGNLSDGTPYIVMEYLEGEPLSALIRRESEPWGAERVLFLADQVAQAIQEAHSRGIIHRDLKPENIFVVPTAHGDMVKVVDFGISKVFSAENGVKLTQTGVTVGTPQYMPVEQLRGAKNLDGRVDVYALGVVMYEMVAGTAPFTGENPVAIAYKQVHDAPTPLNKLVPEVPRAFEAIIARLLAKNPKMRYPTAQDLRDDLRRFRNGEQVHALVAAAARPAGPTKAPVSPDAPTMAVVSTPSPESHEPPTIAGMPDTAPTTAVPTDLSHLPPGASPDARYYEDNNARTGWYALIAFIALIGLVAGAVMLYQNLISNQADESASRILADYTNQPLEQVTAELAELGLSYKPVPENNPLVPEMHVFRTDPVAGEVISEGQVILLYYNPRPELTPVPDVTGMTIADATTTLGAAGFQVAQITEVSNDIEEGRIIRTEPAANEPTALDQIVTMVVSGGADEVAIPASVIGNDVDVARDLLESQEYQFNVQISEEESETVEEGRVIRTNPEVNSLVERGSTIELVVSTGSPQVFVPPFIGMSEEAARDLAQSRGLKVRIVLRDIPAGDDRDGTIIEQSVAQGQKVPKGTTIDVVIGVAPDVTTTTRAATTTTTTPTTTTTTTPTATTPPPTTASP